MGLAWQLYGNVFLPCFSCKARQGRRAGSTFENKKQIGKLMTAQIRKMIFWGMNCLDILPFCAVFGVKWKKMGKKAFCRAFY